jgi:hypothetical protein
MIIGIVILALIWIWIGYEIVKSPIIKDDEDNYK